MYKSTEVGICKLKNGQKTTAMKWMDCPYVAVIVDYGKGNIFVNSREKRLFKITKVYDPEFTNAYTLYKYDTKDLKGKKVVVALSMIKNDAQDWEIGFIDSGYYYVYKMNVNKTNN
ncbi:MAG TPA: hypothetical protein VIH86_13835 [Puia sp.]